LAVRLICSVRTLPNRIAPLWVYFVFVCSMSDDALKQPFINITRLI
jgi:hypothetical protein